MPAPYLAEFWRDLVTVALLHESSTSLIGKDIGIFDAPLHNWLARADYKNGLKHGLTQKETYGLREAKTRILLLVQETEAEPSAVTY